MANTNDLLRNVCASLLDAFGQTPQASSQSILAFEEVGIFPGGSVASAADAVEFVSTYADAVPDISAGVYVRSSRSISTNYDNMLEASVSVLQTQSVIFNTTKAAAQLAHDNSKIGSSDPGVINSFEPVNATPSNWYDATQQSNWLHYSYSSGTPAPPATPPPAPGTGVHSLPPLHVLTPIDPWRFTAMPVATSVTPAPVVNKVPSPVIDRVPTPVISKGPTAIKTFRPLVQNASLARATSPAVNLASSARLATFVLPTRFVTPVNTPPPVPLQPEFSISFDYCIVQLNRIWLSGDFMALPAWYVPGIAQGGYSSGQGAIASAFAGSAAGDQSAITTDQPAAYGPLTFIPTAFVAIKSLAMHVPAGAAGSASSGPVTALGPFAVPTAAGAANGSAGDGIQIIGWICSVQPQLPPVTDPALIPVPASSASATVVSGAPAS
jgi:hypothetical protein